MKDFPVLCSCGQAATFKIAAVWSDGVMQELKTYFLTCQACIKVLLPLAEKKCRACRLTDGEKVEGPYLYKRTAHGLERCEYPQA